MDGSTPVGDRQNLIDKYNGDTTIPIFCFPPKLAAGINLTAADTCIMHDLDFNLQIFKQKIVATHRTKKPVTVYKLVSRDGGRRYLWYATANHDGTAIGQRFYRQRSSQRAALLRTAVDRFLKKSPKAKAPAHKLLPTKGRTNVTEVP
jgi:hypothetical protein